MWWNEYWHGPWMFFGPVMMLVFFAVCVGVMFFAMRGHGAPRGRSLEILRERFARGEIGEAEFQERRRLLES